MPEIQTLNKPVPALNPDLNLATGNQVFEQPVEAKAGTLVLEGAHREITVSDRPAMMSEEDVYWQYGVNLGRLVGKYELPYDASSEQSANHTLFIFDDSNPNARHAAPEKQYTIISQRALEDMGKSNLERRGDTYKNRDVIQIGEGQQLEVGRQWRWLPKETKHALKHEKRRVMSDDQANFYVENGELKLQANGHNGGFFIGVPSASEQAAKQAARDYERRMSAQIHAGKPTTRMAGVTDNAPTMPAVHNADAYVDTAAQPAAQTRHGMHIGTLLRRRRQSAGASTAHDMHLGIRRRR
jgi:hypothetical protein